jgi:predicted dehydrogenase
VRAFSEGFLGSLVHQVNLVHALLAAMGETVPVNVVAGDWWAEGRAVSGAARLDRGGRWDSAWVQLTEVPEYREQITLMFADGVRRLEFPSPWLRQSPTRYSHVRADGELLASATFSGYGESYQRQLEHFHDCITASAACRNPPEQAADDLAVLTRMCLAARPLTAR